MRYGPDSRLDKLPVYVLTQTCVEAQVAADGHNQKLLQALRDYVSKL